MQLYSLLYLYSAVSGHIISIVRSLYISFHTSEQYGEKQGVRFKGRKKLQNCHRTGTIIARQPTNQQWRGSPTHYLWLKSCTVL